MGLFTLVAAGNSLNAAMDTYFLKHKEMWFL
jgi:hypothetical protein